MNKFKIIRIAAWIVFAVSFGIWGYTELLYLDADVTYKDLQKRFVVLAEDPEAPEENTQIEENITVDDDTPMLEIDHEHLLDENRDYKCWLTACNNEVSYPVVQGKNNDEYLHKTFFGDKSFVGSIFIDYRCSDDMSDFHTLLYGHSMKDRTMFRLIADYTNKSFAEQYPCFYIYTPQGRQRYDIFAVYDLPDTELMTALGDVKKEEREAFISGIMQRSLYTLGDTPTADDKIVSLITCDVRNDSKRVVVNGVLKN